MVCFTISLRSPNSTNNWEHVLENFNNTLHSIFNQTCNEFRVYVGCNEIPHLYNKYDDRLRFVTLDLPVPKSWEEKCRHRAWKLLACAKEIKKDMKFLEVPGGGTFVFPVDADDYVNCNVAEYVHLHPEANGFKSAKSYCWVKGKRYMEITPWFGGTMNIMKMREEDLPDDLPDVRLCFDKETSRQLNEKYPIRWSDIDVEKKFAELGKPLSDLPFRSTIYVLGTGNNISSDDPMNKKVKLVGFHPIAFLRKINPFDKKLLTRKIKEEFGMPE